MPSLQLVSQLHFATSKKEIIASCRRHVTRCHDKLNLESIQNKFYAIIAEAELSSALCNICKPKVARQLAHRACYTLQPTCKFSHNAIATHVAKKIAPCNINCRARFYSLERLQNFFEAIATCNMSPATCNGLFFPNVARQVEGKLHRVTIAEKTEAVIFHFAMKEKHKKGGA